jgi:predicted GIY-YIG superfamily endonuclease
MQEKVFVVYIMASQKNGTIYVGVTSDLLKRVYNHKNETLDGFTKKYGAKTLVYYEIHENAESAFIVFLILCLSKAKTLFFSDPQRSVLKGT